MTTTSSPTASTSTMSTEMATTNSGSEVKRRESLNLAPSPTLYNVSLAEAEADDDDEFDSQHQQPNHPIYASSHTNIEFVDNDNLMTTTTLNADERTYEALRNGSTSSTISSSISDSIRASESPSKVLSVPQMAPPPPPPCSTLPSILKLVNNFENHIEAVTPVENNSTTVGGVKLNPDEKVASDVREYWATIDFYNASKLAFNKRCKSVKAKRERIDQEYKQRLQQTPQLNPSTIISSPSITVTHHNSGEEPCMCVKCSIVYHETVIKGIASTSGAPKPACRSATLKDCSTNNSTEQEIVVNSTTLPVTDSLPSPTNRMSINSDDHSTTTDSAMSTTTSDKSESVEIPAESTITNTSATNPGEFAQLDEKLFNIKNELVRIYLTCPLKHFTSGNI